jgi:hypothetical protein
LEVSNTKIELIKVKRSERWFLKINSPLYIRKLK